jgi:hypothetical protein
MLIVHVQQKAIVAMPQASILWCSRRMTEFQSCVHAGSTHSRRVLRPRQPIVTNQPFALEPASLKPEVLAEKSRLPAESG